MPKDNVHIRLTFTESLLGTVPKNKDVYKNYIMTKAAKVDEKVAEELASVEHIEDVGWTGFHTDDKGPFLFDYQLKGYMKDACGCLRRVEGTHSKKCTAYKKIIDGLIFVDPRKLYLNLSGDLEVIERPLRASTPQGERIALARSDAAPVGTTLDCEIVLYDPKLWDLVEEWLEYGKRRGLGQWRNSGAGSFTWAMA